MFFSIYHNQSGDEFIRRIGPNEKLDLRAMVRKWAEREYSCYPITIEFSEWGAHIPNGCGEYQAELRDTKKSGATCWTSEPFYMVHACD